MAGAGGVSRSLLGRVQAVGTLVAPEMRRPHPVPRSKCRGAVPGRGGEGGGGCRRAWPAEGAGGDLGAPARLARPGPVRERQPGLGWAAAGGPGAAAVGHGLQAPARTDRRPGPALPLAGEAGGRQPPLSSASVLCSLAWLEFSFHQSQVGMFEQELAVGHCQDR